jgi:cytoskeletal protein RodZ
MLKRIGEVVVAVLDRVWPFPLGILFAALVLSISAGAWLMFRRPGPAPQTPKHRIARPDLDRLAQSDLQTQPSASRVSEIQAAPSASRNSPVQSSFPKPATSKISSHPTGGGKTSASEPQMRASSVPYASAATPSPHTAPAKPKPKEISPAKPTTQATASPLSPAQRAALQDRLTLGGFFLERQDFPAAIKEFQAALEIDPSSREAQAAIQQAREAGKRSESTVPPP